MTVQMEKVLNENDEFTVHAYNAMFTGKIRSMPVHVQDDMTTALVDHIINQLRPEARKSFLDYVRRRIETV